MAIEVLSPDVAAKIAAGEVAERPWLVVKELVENSLDAGASQVTVEVKGGGIELIRVTDDGCGIPADEVELAFQRHATSKITTATDLGAIATLGFRGEALPSIASVSRVSLVTRDVNAPAGREVQLKWGVVVKNGSKGCPPGTSISVAGLFENLPARRKFLKSPSGETARIGDVVSRYALAFPEVRFQLLVEGRNSLTSPGNGVLGDALVAVYGVETARSLLEVSWQGPGDGYAVSGFVSAPSLSRANRSYITLLVNRRWIQSQLLSFALTESYHGLLPERRHPLAVLNLAVPVADVDVNVHPAKREVRFRQDDRVFSAVQRSARAALVAVSPVPEVRFPDAPSSDIVSQRALPSGPPLPGAVRTSGPWVGPSQVPTAPTPIEAMSSLRILGQVKDTYVVAEGSQGLYLVDQHAAHERVLFEKVTRGFEARVPQSQALLEPVTVDLSPSQDELVRDAGDVLERFGFALEPFGPRTYLIRALPAVVSHGSPAKALVEVLDLMAYERLVKEREGALAASIACHSAVRAGMSLSPREMEELISQLKSCDSPHTCPHGRPTMIHLSSHHLEREFGRR